MSTNTTAPITVVYIAGAGRSGSTLLESLLTRRPGYFAVGELCYIWSRGVLGNERCSCGEPFDSCPFWSGVLAQAFPSEDAVPAEELQALQARVLRMRHIPLLRVPTLRPHQLQADLDRLFETLTNLYLAIQARTGASVLVDSSKFATFGHVLADCPGIDLRVVHLVRDSRAVAFSWQRRVRRPEATEDNAYMPIFSPQKSATIWMQDNAFAGGLRRHVAHGALLRYEDLVEDPTLVDELLARLGLAGAELGVGHDVDQTETGNPSDLVRHSVSGNPSRMDGTARPVKLDAVWKSAMDPSSRAVVTRLTAPALFRYGYPLRDR